MKNPKNKISGLDNLEGVLAFAEELEALVNRISPYEKKLGRACDRMQRVITRLKDEVGDVAVAGDFTEFEEEIVRFYGELMAIVNSVYYVASQPITMYGLRNEDTALREDTEFIGKSMLGIEACAWKGMILIRMPMIGRRVPYIGNGYGGRGIVYQYSKVYSASVAQAVQIVVEDQIRNYEDFYYKTIFFNYVYPADAGSVIDSDSHDAKAIIDAIATRLPGGDSARCCSIYFSSAFRNDIPEGTYICVCPGKDMPQAGSILEDFREAFKLG